MSNLDLRGVFGALGELAQARHPDQAAPAVLAAAIASAGADSAVFTRIDAGGATFWVWPPESLDGRQQALFEAVNAAHPWPLATHTREGPGMALRISDIWSLRQYRSTPMYCELFQDLGIRHQVAFSLPTRAGHSLCVALQRHRNDFTDTDCDNLNSLRSYLSIIAQRQALWVRDGVIAPVKPLTPRECEILHLTATGLSNVQIGRRLDISGHTVSKHLQHLYRKMEVTNRTQAADRARLLSSPSAPTVDAFTAVPE